MNKIKSKISPYETSAMELAAGNGRVAEHVLMPHFKYVDIMDGSKNFLKQAEDRLGDRVR